MNGLLCASKLFMKRHGSTILTIAGSVGVITTVYMAVKATPEANELLKKATKKKGEELTTAEKIKIAGPSYMSTFLIGVSTVSCIFAANILNKRHQASLVSAYTMLDNSYKVYKRKLKELYGEEAHEKIVSAIAVEKAENVGVRSPGFIGNNTLYTDEYCGEIRTFYDEYGGRFFEATLEQVMAAEYHLNRNYVLRGYTILNEFYDFLGLEPTELGSDLGWAINDDGSFWIEFNHNKVNIDGVDCIIIEMPFGPDLEWREYY